MIDVVVEVFGKPWQTLCTLKSLLLHSGKHIDKIYIIYEAKLLYNDPVEWINQYFDNVIIYKHKEYYANEFYNPAVIKDNYDIRYQYGIEKSDKKHVFITHNDILYTDDVIGDMLSKIDDCVGIGLIGMCWNCPIFHKGLCDSEKFESYKPTYEEVTEACKDFNLARIFPIIKEQPMPLPECRLNEFSCLIDREITIKECTEVNTYFGFFGLDIACQWFRSLVLKGYKFRNYNIFNNCLHGFYAQHPNGSDIMFNEKRYWEVERKAEIYFNENFSK